VHEQALRQGVPGDSNRRYLPDFLTPLRAARAAAVSDALTAGGKPVTVLSG